MTKGTPPATAPLPMRDCYKDWAHVESRLDAKSGEPDPPLVTIAIPTFKRPQLLAEAVASALAQRFDGTVEILIVDNDPDSMGAAALLDRVGGVGKFRYFVNNENLGMFGNWNRCISLARSEWVTILNDDDLLDPDFLSQMFATLRRDPGIDGIVCRKRSFDQRVEKGPEPSPFRRAGKQAVLETSFRRQSSRRIGPDKFFWGALLGNGGGFLFRKRCAEAIGGYYAEEFPSADQWFYVRFADRFHLRQHRAILASIRTAENESMRLDTAQASLRSMMGLQAHLLGHSVPTWWRRFQPLVVARDVSDLARHSRLHVRTDDIEAQFGAPLRERRYLLWAIRVALGGM